jgi:adenosine kinase
VTYTAEASYRIGIIAPDGRDAMWQHAHQLAEQKIPFIFDPGQGLPMFSGDDLMQFAGLVTAAYGRLRINWRKA